MVHYWGAKAILERLGYSPKSYRRFPAFILYHKIPCFKKRDGRHRRPMYYTNDELLIRMEMVKARQCYEDLLAKYGSPWQADMSASERAKQAQSQVA